MSRAGEQTTEGLGARACLSSYAVLLSLCALPVIVGATVGITAADWTVALYLAVIGVVSALWVIFWLSRFRLSIADDVLSYRTLTGTQDISLNEIDRGVIETISRGRGSYHQLSIYTLEDPERAAIRINIKVFSRDSLRRFFDALGPRMKGPREIGIIFKEKM